DADQETCRYPLFRDHAEVYLHEPAQLSGRGAGRLPGGARIAVALGARAGGDEAAQRAEEHLIEDSRVNIHLRDGALRRRWITWFRKLRWVAVAVIDL